MVPLLLARAPVKLSLRRILPVAFGAASVLVVAVPAWATPMTFVLNTPGAGLSCDTVPVTGCGTVTLTQDGSNVDVSVTLAGTDKFVNTGGSHEAFAFNLLGDPQNPTVTVTQPTGENFYLGPVTPPSTGQFDYYINCNTCGNGNAGSQPSPLKFTVDNVTIADFVGTTPTSGIYFAADIINHVGKDGSNGATGEVVALGGVDAVPEPVSLVLFGSGLAYTALRRRKRA